MTTFNNTQVMIVGFPNSSSILRGEFIANCTRADSQWYPLVRMRFSSKPQYFHEIIDHINNDDLQEYFERRYTYYEFCRKTFTKTADEFIITRNGEVICTIPLNWK